MKNAMLWRGARSQKCEGKRFTLARDQLSPKHNQNIRDVVHPSPVYEFGFFVSRRHEQQTTRNEELHILH